MDNVLLVTAADKPSGSLPRGELGKMPGLHFATAHVFLFDRPRRLLLQRLAARRDRNPLRWGSSVAGYVHAGETYREAAARRMTEELGIAVALTLIGKTEMPDLNGTKHIALFTAEIEPSQPRVREPNHVAETRWFETEQLRMLTQAEPSRFTETFRWLFDGLFGGRRDRGFVA